jgi:branched-chain amino acid transport system permease protein
MLVFGPVLTLLIIFYPRGIVGAVASWTQKRKASGHQTIMSAKKLPEEQVKEG